MIPAPGSEMKNLKYLNHLFDPRHNTRREGDIEFTTDPNFFEQIFNALTIVGTLEIDPRIYHEY